jgi:hypothetical protein
MASIPEQYALAVRNKYSLRAFFSGIFAILTPQVRI